MRLPTRSRARLFSTVALAAGAAATLGYSGAPAMAQGFFFWGGDSAPRAEPPRDLKHVARPQRNVGGRKASLPAAEKNGVTTGREAKAETPQFDRPLFAIASIADQHVSIYNHHGLVVRSAISTGIPGHPTPKGIFTIIGRERFHRSNIYSSAPMPFMQRITWSGIAMHLGVVPGHPASHGCIRLPAAFAAKLWGMTRIGERVVISPHDVAPAEFDHALLPQPKMLPSVEADKTAVAADRAIAPQRQEAKADGASEAGDAAKAVADAQPQAPALAEAPGAKPEQPKVEAADAAKGVPVADPQQKAPNVADAPAAKAEPSAEQQKAEVPEPAEAAKATAAADLQPAAPAVAEAPVANPPQQAEQPKIDAGAGKASASAGSSPIAVAERPTLNPQQYARQLKAKAAADVAASTSAVKALTAEVAAKQREAARAAAELRTAEAAQAWARTKADAAAASYDASTNSAAGQREPAETAERVALAGDASAKAKADGLTRAYGKALLAQDAALLAKTNADSVLAEATAKLDQARTASAARDSELADADRRLDEARTSAAAATAAQREADRRATPLSILISKKEGRIYVRQGLSPLFDAPIDIRDPKAPLGSHLYIATAANEDGNSLKWWVVTMPARLGDEPSEGRRTASAETGMSWNLRSSTSPTEALERVDIPKDVRDRIGERLWTGASLIISDQPVSSETGAVGTDLTIKLR